MHFPSPLRTVWEPADRSGPAQEDRGSDKAETTPLSAQRDFLLSPVCAGIPVVPVPTLTWVPLSSPPSPGSPLLPTLTWVPLSSPPSPGSPSPPHPHLCPPLLPILTCAHPHLGPLFSPPTVTCMASWMHVNSRNHSSSTLDVAPPLSPCTSVTSSPSSSQSTVTLTVTHSAFQGYAPPSGAMPPFSQVSAGCV